MTTFAQTATVTGAQGAASGAGGSFLAGLADRIAEYRRYRRTLTELSALSDRELDDIGVSRGDVPFVARRSARAA